jgi:hypothetical protein
MSAFRITRTRITHLPITTPLSRLWSDRGGADERRKLVSVRLAAILAPSHLRRVGLEINSGDMITDADLSAEHAGEDSA